MRLLIIIISLMFLLQQHNGKHRLVVIVNGLKPLKGDLYISLHQRPEYFYFADSSLMKSKISVDAAMQTIVFGEVSDGRYAVAVYHDENLNGFLDENDVGIPREGYGFSTNPKGAGRPRFGQVAFDLSRNDTVEIKMIYHPVPGPKKDTIK